MDDSKHSHENGDVVGRALEHIEEPKMLSAGQGVEALLAPDPKSRCTVDSQRTAVGRYDQAITYPQKSGGSVHIARSGTEDASGLVGRRRWRGRRRREPRA